MNHTSNQEPAKPEHLEQSFYSNPEILHCPIVTQTSSHIRSHDDNASMNQYQEPAKPEQSE